MARAFRIIRLSKDTVPSPADCSTRDIPCILCCGSGPYPSIVGSPFGPVPRSRRSICQPLSSCAGRISCPDRSITSPLDRAVVCSFCPYGDVTSRTFQPTPSVFICTCSPLTYIIGRACSPLADIIGRTRSPLGSITSGRLNSGPCIPQKTTYTVEKAAFLLFCFS